MPGIADPGNSIGPINPQSLIGNASPVVEPRAVSALTDAFRNGTIQAQDIIDRVGELGQTRRKAEIEVAKRTAAEASDPALIEARKQQQLAAGSAAQLSQAQSQAGMGLVQPQTDVARTQLELQQAQAKYGSGIQDFQQLAPLTTGYDGKAPTKPDGSPDFDLMGVEGNHLKSIYNQRLIGMERLKPVKTEDRPGPGGVMRRISYNAFGEDVSPDPSNRTYQMYNQMASQPLNFKFLKPGEASSTVAPAAPSAPAAPATPITAAQTDADRAKLVEQQGMNPVDAVKLSPSDIQSKFSSQDKPTVTPSDYSPGAGVSVGFGEVPKPADLTEQFRKQKSYEAWNASKPFYNAMANTMKQVNSIPLADQRAGKVNLNAQDIELVSNFVKLYDPNAVIREFKFDKIEHSQPLPDQLANWMSTIKRSGQLTPETRQELFRTATEAFRAKEQSIVPDLQMASERAHSYGFKPEQVLNPEEQHLLGGNQTPSYSPAKSAPKAAGPVISLSNGQRVYRGADGQYYQSQ